MMEYYAAGKMNKLDLHASAWINLKNIMFSKLQMNMYSMRQFCNILKESNNVLFY